MEIVVNMRRKKFDNNSLFFTITRALFIDSDHKSLIVCHLLSGKMVYAFITLVQCVKFFYYRLKRHLERRNRVSERPKLFFQDYVVFVHVK